MRLTVEELLRSVRWTLAERIAPSLADPLTQSYLRSVDALLVQIERRIAHEPAALRAEIEDLSRLLERIGAELPAVGPPRAATVHELNVEALRLRGELVRVMPSLRDDAREQVRAYLGRQIAREASFMPEMSGAP
jgi:hypothetical protein